MKKISCGGLIFADGKMLIIRPRWDSPKWNIPKGEIHLEEDPLTCAKREIEEETGISPDLYYHVIDLGLHSYLPHKDVHLFAIVLKNKPEKLICNSFFTEGGKKTPEVVAFDWVPWELVPSRVSTPIQKIIEQVKGKING